MAFAPDGKTVGALGTEKNEYDAAPPELFNFKLWDAATGRLVLELKGANTLARKGVARLLAVGVNSYANQRYDLKYAVADANAFGEEFKRQQERLGHYASVETRTLTDKQATKAGILTALAELAAKAEPEDAVVVFFAGHGTARENRFYLLPHDLGYAGAPAALDRAALEKMLASGVNDRELEKAFEKIDAARRVPEIQLDEIARAAAAGRQLSFADEDRGLNLERRQTQRPRLYYRRELEARPLVVATTGN